VYTQMQKIKTLEQVYELRSRQVNILTQSIETSSELFKMGRSNYLEVLITQQNALHSKLERITTRRDQFQATINIYKALGGGWRQ
jgi:multidrug efflux system outer membrane protein